MVDARFDASGDPTFRQIPAKRRKVHADGRFKAVIRDAAPAMDPFGRAAIFKQTPEQIAQRDDYALSSDGNSSDGNSSDSDRSNSSAASRGGGGVTRGQRGLEIRKVFEWDVESDSSDGEEEEEDDEERNACEDEAAYVYEPEEDVPLGDATRRVAIMSCKWEMVEAKDLFVLVYSILEKSERPHLRRAAIYASDFGEQRLKEEEQNGPKLDLPKLADDDDVTKSLLEHYNPKRVGLFENEAEKLQQKIDLALRKYQEEKSRYYFAVIELSSVATAQKVYDELEGTDTAFAMSGGLDVRFIPDDLPPFDDSFPRRPRSVCTELPDDGYTAPKLAASAGATCIQRNKLDWDGEDVKRQKLLRKKFSDADVQAMDLQDYLASSSSSEDEGETPCEVYYPPEITARLEAKQVPTKLDDVAEIRRRLLGEDFDREIEEKAKKIEEHQELTVHVGSAPPPLEGFDSDGSASGDEDKDFEAALDEFHNVRAPAEDSNKSKKPSKRRQQKFPLIATAKAEDKDEEEEEEDDEQQISQQPRRHGRKVTATAASTTTTTTTPLATPSTTLLSTPPPSSRKKKRKGGKKHRAIAERNDVERGSVGEISKKDVEERFPELKTDARFAIDSTIPAFTHHKF